MLGDIAIQFSVFINSGAVGSTFAFCCCISLCNNIYYLVQWQYGGIRSSNKELSLIWWYILWDTCGSQSAFACEQLLLLCVLLLLSQLMGVQQLL